METRRPEVQTLPAIDARMAVLLHERRLRLPVTTTT
jgi:hypothetical protein